MGEKGTFMFESRGSCVCLYENVCVTRKSSKTSQRSETLCCNWWVPRLFDIQGGQDGGAGSGEGFRGLKTRNARWVLIYWLDDSERTGHNWILRGQWDPLTGMLIYWTHSGCLMKERAWKTPAERMGNASWWDVQQVHAVTRVLYLPVTAILPQSTKESQIK